MYSERYVKEKLAHGTAGRRRLVDFEREFKCRVYNNLAFCHYLDTARALTILRNRMRGDKWNKGEAEAKLAELERNLKEFAKQSTTAPIRHNDVVESELDSLLEE